MATKEEETFAPEEREKHKKKQLVVNSLGALLSGISSSGPPTAEKVVSSSSEISVVTNSFHSGNGKASSHGWAGKEGGSSGANYRGADDYKKPKLEDSNTFMNWSETRKFDEDLDKEWLESEHRRLDDLYGEGIVTLKYSDQGILSYYCELCYAHMNALIPLESHCSGMKHLKKKDIFEKNKATRDVPLRKRALESVPPGPPRLGRGESRTGLDPYSEPGSHRSGRDEWGHPSNDGSRDPYGSSGYGYKDYGTNRSRSPRSKEKDYGMTRPRSPRSSELDPYRKERDYYDYPKDPYSRSKDRYEPYDRSARDLSSYPDKRSPRHSDRTRSSSDLIRRPEDRSLYARNRSRTPEDLYRPRDDRSPYAAERPPYSGFSSLYPSDHRDDRKRSYEDIVVPKVPSPPPAKPPAPIISSNPVAPSVNSEDKSSQLAGGPAAALLTKLAHCTVKNEGDAELASNVINLLLKSLKEYNEKLGEKSVASLMEQAEIKLGTAKAIRVIRKPSLTPTPPPDAISLAMNTLRRANAEDPPDFPSLGNLSTLYRRF